MKVVFGVGKLGKAYCKTLSEQGVDFYIYDNDRRKWGTELFGKRIMSYSELLELIHKNEVEIICTIRNMNAKYFLKDLLEQEKDSFTVWDYTESDEIYQVDLLKLQEFEIDLLSLHQKRMEEYAATAEYYKERNPIAYKHALDYVARNKDYPESPEVYGFELTNNCNLSCPNCPTPTTKRVKGLMSEEVFEETLKNIPPNMNAYVTVHGFGEPLIHPRFFDYLERVIQIGVPICVGSNGELLTEEKVEKMFALLNSAADSRVYLSLHTKKSVQAWMKCVEWLEKHPNNIGFLGNMIEHNANDVRRWLDEENVSDVYREKYIRDVTSHSFAGNVKGRKHTYNEVEVKNRYRNCCYCYNNWTEVTWDGRLKSCCLDSEVNSDIGTIFEIHKSRVSTKCYDLCHTCDPDWTSSYQ